MAKKKKKPNIASIMANHDKMFRSLAPGNFGKVPPVFKQSEKEMQQSKKPKRQKRRDQRRASVQPETSVIDVLSSGVVDAISGATFGLETTFGGYFQQGGMATSSSNRQDDAPREAAQPNATQDTSPGVKAQASGGGDKPQGDSQPIANADDDLKEFEVDPDLQEFDVSGEGELQTTGVGEPLDQPDVASEVQSSVSSSIEQDVSEATDSVQATVSQGVSEQVASLESSRSQDFGKEMNEVSGKEVSSKSSNPRIAKRREAAKKEREAAARNFRRQRGESVPPPPIAGIPNPIPSGDDFELANIPGEEKADSVTSDEKRVAENASSSGTVEFAKSTTGLLEKMGTEMQALAVRIKNIENMIDRL
jgi:hypothetical protein